MTYEKIIFAALWFLSFSLTAAAYNTYAPNSWDTVKKKPGTIRPFTTFVKKGRAPDYDRNFFDRGSLTRYELASVLKKYSRSGEKGSTLYRRREEETCPSEKEYIRELDALGYSDEKKKKEPIIEISGDARVRWTKGEENDARIRTGAKWNIGNSTYIQGQGSINS